MIWLVIEYSNVSHQKDLTDKVMKIEFLLYIVI